MSTLDTSEEARAKLGIGTLWTPADNNLIWGSFAPVNAGGANVPSAVNVPGKLTLQRVLLRESATISKVWLGVSANDAGATFSDCYIGLYNSSGTLLTQTADISTELKTAVVYGITLTPTVTVPAGEYFVAMLLNGSWTTFNLKSSLGGITTNAGLSAPHLTLSSISMSVTALPASITLASMTTGLITGGWGSQWYGLS